MLNKKEKRVKRITNNEYGITNIDLGSFALG